jgi:RNA-binding protein
MKDNLEEKTVDRAKSFQLNVKQRQQLKGLAHSLDPVVMIGDKGLTESVVVEINRSLDAHELIKIRVLGDDRNYREELISKICDSCDSHLVQHIGKLIVIYRKHPKKPKIVLV